MRRRSTRLRSAILAFTLMLGAVVLGWAVSAESDTSPIPPSTLQAVSISVPKMPSHILASNFEAIAERPLFSQTRKPTPPKPPPVPTEVKQEPTTPPLTATLLGTVISPNLRSAVLRLAKGKSVTVAEGEAVDGWVLKEVAPDLVRFHSKTATVELSFPMHQSSTIPAGPSAVPGPLVRRRR